MKKQLLATTALVAVGVLAAADGANAQTVKLGVGGFMSQEFGFVFDKKDGNTNGRNDVSGTGADTGVQFDQQTDIEIYFLGVGKLDNGIEIGARVELEVAGSPGNQIDEHFLFVRGSFGMIELGSTDSAAIKTTLGYMGSWATQVGENIAFGPGDWLSGATTGTSGAGNMGGADGTLRNMQLRMFDDDGNKISYYSPRVEGFQIGISYTPNTHQNNFAGTGGTPPNSGTGTELVTNTQGVYHDFTSIGGNYEGKFGDLGVGIGAGYVRAKSPGRVSADTTTTWKNTNDPETYGVGVALEWGPFKISGAYRENKNVIDGAGTVTTIGGQTTTTVNTSLDGRLYDIGARYTFGPNAVSIAYRNGNVEGTKADTGKYEETAFMASYRRILGPGVDWRLNLFHQRSETEDAQLTAVNSLVGTNYQNNPKTVSGWAMTTGLMLSF